MLLTGLKQCSSCKEKKPASQFSRDMGKRDGLSPWCKECYREYNHFLCHGVTLAQKHQCYLTQDGKCQMCCVHRHESRLVVDLYQDDFNLICSIGCKKILDFSKNKIEILTKAKQYLIDAEEKVLLGAKRIHDDNWQDIDSVQEATKIKDGIEYHRCKKCGEYRLSEGFYDNKYICIECEKSSKRKHRYGVDTDIFDHLKGSQKKGCAICGQSCKTGRELSVDHCHATGQVRGLLCMTCNFLIAVAKEDTKMLDAAIVYRKSYPLAELVL